MMTTIRTYASADPTELATFTSAATLLPWDNLDLVSSSCPEDDMSLDPQLWRQ